MEEWRPVSEEFGGRHFEVSSIGRVRSTDRYMKTRWSQPRLLKGHILPIRLDRDGYWKVTLNLESKTQTPFVHRLVARAFIGVCPEGQQVRHLDGNPANSNVSNLCYGTPLQNVDDKYAHGTQRYLKGSILPQAVINERIALEIDSMLKTGIRGVDIANHFQVTPQLVSSVKKGVAWSHVTGREKKRKSVRENEIG